MRGLRARVVAPFATALCLTGVAASEGAAPTAVTINPAVLPSGTVRAAYRQEVTVSGPSPPYAVRVTQGALPPGLSLSPGGSLAGVPAKAGSSLFTISAFTADGVYVGFRDYVMRISPTTRRGRRAYFADDFEKGLEKWNLWGQEGAYGLVRGRTGQAASITVGPSTTGPTSAGSELASLWLDWPVAYAGAGQSTWYSAKVRFPRGYRATAGQWNWFIEWHVDDATGSYPGAHSAALGVFTDYPVTTHPGSNPRLAFRIKGGSVTSPRQYVFALRPNSLKRDWWYDVVVHFVWSPDERVGLAELWLDRILIVSKRAPTLYRHPSGESSYNYFGLYNYRPKASWDASIHFDRVRIGPTRASVVEAARAPTPRRGARSGR